MEIKVKHTKWKQRRRRRRRKKERKTAVMVGRFGEMRLYAKQAIHRTTINLYTNNEWQSERVQTMRRNGIWWNKNTKKANARNKFLKQYILHTIPKIQE